MDGLWCIKHTFDLTSDILHECRSMRSSPCSLQAYSPDLPNWLIWYSNLRRLSWKLERMTKARKANELLSQTPSLWKPCRASKYHQSWSLINNPWPDHPNILAMLRELRSVQSLESACGTLEKQFEQCELIKLDTSGLQDENLGEQSKKELLTWDWHNDNQSPSFVPCICFFILVICQHLDLGFYFLDLFISAEDLDIDFNQFPA